ncbi:YihY/virulence factor BrkB family protein [Thioclava sp.]|uniref:YihY/virulence factor BrkB family protein n=1 Tax=Thioclava sp. TaxID=1933450 RepID=UPI003242301D
MTKRSGQGPRDDAPSRRDRLVQAGLLGFGFYLMWRRYQDDRQAAIHGPTEGRSARHVPATRTDRYDRPADRALGRQAESPFEIPRAGWKAIAKRAYGQIDEDRVLAVAAGVTFYALLALFPALTATVSIYGIFADRQTMLQDLDALKNVIPPEALTLIRNQLEQLIGSSSNALGLASIFGVLLALWSANGGAKAMIGALNVAYGEKERRSFVQLNAFGLGMTITGIVMVCALILVAAVLPVMLDYIPMGGALDAVLRWGRWPVMALVLVGMLMLLYRYAPARNAPRWIWVVPGAIAASILLLIVSAGFSFYTSNFANYSSTYGSIGAVVVLMMWIWLSTTAVLLGAEINSEAEHQTAQDSTIGDPRPLGARNAVVADAVAPAPARKR